MLSLRFTSARSLASFASFARFTSIATFVLLTAVAHPLMVHAQGWIVPRPCMLPAVLDERVPVRLRDCRPNVVRTRSDVHVELEDHVLHYEVEERFVNRGGTVAEADYLFPLPNGAAFQDLKLSINGELVAGETMNASDARTIYERIVRAQRDPALVEWMGHGLLRARIFPLNPGEEKRIIVRFQSVAPREGDALRVDYFRGAAPGDAGAGGVRDAGTSAFTLSYRASSQLGAPYSPTHAMDVTTRDGKQVATVRGDARDVTVLVPVRRPSAASIAMLPYAPGNEDGFALVTVTAPQVARAESTPRDVTLVLDVSGSMQGRKMEQARAAGRQLLGTLRPDDRFRLIDFSSDVRTFRDELVPATGDNLRAAMRYLDALEAQGGTNIEGALREAVRPAVTAGRLPLVLFVTDGEPTVGEQRPDQLAAIASDASRRDRETRRIFTFGLGSDVNVSLLEQLAMDGRGTSQFVRPDESVERMVGVVASRLVDPVLTDVRVHVEGDVRLSKLLPAQPADIFADRDLVVLARYSGQGTARVVVDGTRRGAPVQWSTTVEFPARQRENPFVARLWATQRVGFLSAEKRKHGSSELDEEIRMLGERYGIPTEFTSYLVTEPRLAATTGFGMPAAAPRVMRLQQATEARSAQFEQAKMAAAQRSVQSIAMMDSAAAGDASTRRVDTRSFRLARGVWTDVRYHDGMPMTTVVPFSKAYFDLIDALPELRRVFALGDQVIVVGHDRAIALGEHGVTTLSAAERSAIMRAW